VEIDPGGPAGQSARDNIRAFKKLQQKTDQVNEEVNK